MAVIIMTIIVGMLCLMIVRRWIIVRDNQGMMMVHHAYGYMTVY